MDVVASHIHLAHDALEIHNGEFARSFESPERASLIAKSLAGSGHAIVEPDTLPRPLLERIHTDRYIEFLESAWGRWVERFGEDRPVMSFAWPARTFGDEVPDDLVGQLGFYSFAADSLLTAGLWEAIMSSASIAVTAADRVLERGEAVYGLCRPPGHHASAEQFGGYCFFNNAALAAQRLLDSGMQRVGILDLDYHHGNGTQSIFYERSDVRFVSLHADPRQEFPWFAGHANERGAGPGEGHNLNLPLPQGSGFGAWARALEEGLAVMVGIDGLVVSLGVDTYEHDPLGTFGLTTANFAEVGARIAQLDLPTVVIQEGGYAVSELGINVAGFLSAFGRRDLSAGDDI